MLMGLVPVDEGVCTLWLVSETNQDQREMNTWSLDDGDPARGE